MNDISDVFFNNSSLAWVFQTYVRLNEQGFSCQLVDSMPEEGIVVVHRGDLPFNTKPNSSTLLVTTLGDGGRHPYAQVQIVQNPSQLNGRELNFFMHHWTQPGLIPRVPDRAEVFKNVGYFGHPGQLADKLHTPRWTRFLAERDLNWIPVHKDSDRQSDYSDIDLIVAIRSFDGRAYDHKPATKLHNAWLAGVPAILGPESAYRAERTHEMDYLEACTYTELCQYIDELHRNPKLRRRLRVRSEENRTEIKPARKAEDWWELLTGPVQDLYTEWVGLSIARQKLFFAKRWCAVKWNGISQRAGT